MFLKLSDEVLSRFLLRDPRTGITFRALDERYRHQAGSASKAGLLLKFLSSPGPTVLTT